MRKKRISRKILEIFVFVVFSLSRVTYAEDPPNVDIDDFNPIIISPNPININPSANQKFIGLSKVRLLNLSQHSAAESFLVKFYLNPECTTSCLFPGEMLTYPPGANPGDPFNPKYTIVPDNNKAVLLGSRLINRLDGLLNCARGPSEGEILFCSENFPFIFLFSTTWADGTPVTPGDHFIDIVAEPVLGETIVSNNIRGLKLEVINNPVGPGGETCPLDGCSGTGSSNLFAEARSDTKIFVKAIGGAISSPHTDRYDLEHSTKSDFSSNVTRIGFTEVGSDLISQVGSLKPGTTYYFRYRRVVDGCAAGISCTVGAQGWSSKAWATTASPVGNPSPADKAKGVSKSVTLKWQGGRIADQSVSYDLYWGTGDSTSNHVSLGSTASYAPPTLREGTKYSWRVESRSGAATVKGPTWSFTVTGPPNVPNKPVPGVGAGMVSSTQPWFGWFGGSPNPNDQITYDVYLGKEVVNKCPLRDSDRQCSPVFTKTSTETWVTTPAGLIGLTDTSTYYWKVVAKSGTHTVEGPVWWFFTEGNTYQISAPGRPKLFPKVHQGTGSYLVVWQELGPSFYYDIRGSIVRNDGTILVPDIPINVNGTTNLTSKTAPAVAFGGNYLVVWWDTRNGTYADVFGALVRSDGLIIKNNILISTAGSKTAFQNFAQTSPDVSWDPVTGHYFVVWMDNRSGTNFDIYGARVDDFTGDVLDLNGILISNATRPGGAVATQQYPTVEGGGGFFWVTWEDGRNFGTHIYGARVRASDGALLDPNGISVSIPGSGRFAASAFDGQNFLTVWQDSRSNIGNGWNIMGTRIRASDGAVLDRSSIRIADAPGQQMAPAVTYGNSKFFVVWEDLRDHVFCAAEDSTCDWNPYAAWVRLDGVVLDRLNISLTKKAGAQRRPAAAFDIYTSSYFAIWEDWQTTPAQIWGQGRGTNFFKPGLGDDLTPPSVPADLRASAASTTQIDLSWSASTDNVDGVGVDRYSIYRCIGVTQSCTAGNGSYRGDSVNILFSDTGLAPNTAYTYTVIAIDGDGNRSAAASPASATTLSNIDLIASSVGTSASARSGSPITVTHSVQNKGTGNAGSFVVKYYLASDDPVTSGTLLTTRSFPSGLASGATFTESFSLTIPAGTAQGIYALGMIVDADDQVVESEEENNLLTLPITIDDTSPTVSLTAPTNGSGLCCTVTVAASASDNFEMSLVIFLLDGIPVSQDVDGADGWSWTWNTVTATDGTHTLTAKAVDAAGNSTVSAAVTVQVYNPPVAPTGLSVADVAGDQGGALRLTWTVSTSTDITQQRIYRGTASGGPYSLVTTITGNTTSSYTNTGLTNGTTYYYVIRAFDGSTESVNSNVGSAIPRDNLAPTISNVAAGSITTGGATITWTTNEASDTQVEYGTTTSYGNSTTLNTTMVISHSATLTGLSSSTLYHYRVKSRDAAGNLATSGDFTFTTASPGGPDLTQLWVAISTITSSSITINDVVRNIGNVNAGAFDIGFYLSTDTTYQSSDPFLCKRSLSGLAAGTSNPPSGTAVTTCSISTVAPGLYYVIGFADSGASVAEKVETNNTRPSSQIVVGPDLIVSLISASKSSNTLTIQNAVKNQGTAAAGASEISFYLSTDQTLSTASDTFVCKRSVTSLAAGTSNPASDCVKTPFKRYHV